MQPKLAVLCVAQLGVGIFEALASRDLLHGRYRIHCSVAVFSAAGLSSSFANVSPNSICRRCCHQRFRFSLFFPPANLRASWPKSEVSHCRHRVKSTRLAFCCSRTQSCAASSLGVIAWPPCGSGSARMYCVCVFLHHSLGSACSQNRGC